MSDREKLIEAMARAAYENAGYAYEGRAISSRGPYGVWALTVAQAAAALTALEATHVVVPREPPQQPEDGDWWLIRKNGYFYRPNCAGYTSNIEEAGRYTEDRAKKEARVEPDNISAIKLSEYRKAMIGAAHD